MVLIKMQRPDGTDVDWWAVRWVWSWTCSREHFCLTTGMVAAMLPSKYCRSGMICVVSPFWKQGVEMFAYCLLFCESQNAWAAASVVAHSSLTLLMQHQLRTEVEKQLGSVWQWALWCPYFPFLKSLSLPSFLPFPFLKSLPFQLCYLSLFGTHGSPKERILKNPMRRCNMNMICLQSLTHRSSFLCVAIPFGTVVHCSTAVKDTFTVQGKLVGISPVSSSTLPAGDQEFWR